jgi:diguanylate cyclase (GGDEF)-like protein/PAS domain S-box-containing protein
MKKKDPDAIHDAIQSADGLRRRAEQRLQAQQPDDTILDTDARKLLQELQIHQIELEMQNEELQHARAEAEAASAHYMELYDLAPIGYFTLGREGNILQVNLTGARLLSKERSRLVGRRFDQFFVSEERPLFRELLEQIFDGQTRETVDLSLEREDAEPCIVQIEAIADASGQACRVVVTDVTARKHNEEKARLASTVFRIMDEGVLVSDRENRIIAVNPAFTDITGYSFDEVSGRDPRMLASGRHPPEFYQEMWNTLATTYSWQGEIWDRAKSGAIYVRWLSIKQIRDERGHPSHYVAIFSDISKRKTADQRMYHLAYHDALTDLPNRVLFFDRLHQALKAAERDNKEMALIFIDLDKFKPVNDLYGHNIGDLLLQEVAARISHCIRESDTAARLGGDEFIVLLPSIDEEQGAVVTAEKIRNALDQPYELAGHSLNIGSSAGVAVHPEHGVEENTLLNNADVAMYFAKKSGGNNVALFKNDMHEIRGGSIIRS